ncbi:MAG: hypothetical protein EHM61_05650 [Acidobacteria bacterium]|nr:MAG: hypothetical protein EHM61_05650 [Acidobacteriota bacterium]
MRKGASFLFLILMASSPVFPQLPDFYKGVDRVTWVVDDLTKVMDGWRGLGFQDMQEFGEVDLTNEQYRGQPVDGRARVAVARLGSVNVTWLQPISGKSLYSDFLARKGPGIIGLTHRTPTLSALENEVKRLASLGVGVLGKGTIPTDSGEITYVYFDTEAEGKYILGLINYPGDMAPDSSPRGPANLKLSQYAFVSKDLDKPAGYWQKLGFPQMSVTHGELKNLQHRGQPGQFDQKLGWQRHGAIVYEWILPLKGPTVYEEHLTRHGEGFHHLAFDVDDMDKVTADWAQKGFPIVQAGAWGDEGKPGSGRFAYSDTTVIGGICIEFLWNHKGN